MPAPKGMIPWNKGKKGLQVAWNKGKTVPAMTAQNNPSWKGGCWQQADGYVWKYAPTHPRAKSHGAHVFEHILVAEHTLGRYLTSQEVVHHINGIRNDNRPENLVVLTRATHILEHLPYKLHGKWSHQYGTACRECKTKDRRHWSKGLCKRCYVKQFRPSRARRLE